MAERVRSNFCLFADSIFANEIMYGLYEKRALTDDDLDEIDSIAANRQKTIKLIRILLAKKDFSWVYSFRDTLQSLGTEHMQNLARILDSDSPVFEMEQQNTQFWVHLSNSFKSSGWYFFQESESKSYDLNFV